jgi:hypothetical protein
MKFKQYLEEDYVTRDQRYEVFKNPTPKELSAVCCDIGIRFIMDMDKKDIYVWKGSIYHYIVYNKLIKEKIFNNMNELNSFNFKILSGNVEEMSGGKMDDVHFSLFGGTETYLDEKHKERLKEISNLDFSWVDHYFKHPIKYYIEKTIEFLDDVKLGITR